MSNKAVFSFLGLFFQDRFSDVFISLCTLVFSSFHIYFSFGWEEPDLWIETFGFKSQVHHILHVWAQASYLTSLSLNFLTYKMRKRSNNHCKGIVREFVDIGHHHWRTTEPGALEVLSKCQPFMVVISQPQQPDSSSVSHTKWAPEKSIHEPKAWLSKDSGEAGSY